MSFINYFHAFSLLISVLPTPFFGRRYVLQNKTSRLLTEDVTSFGRRRYGLLRLVELAEVMPRAISTVVM